MSNSVMENILSRRSVRAFNDKKIPRNELEEIIKAGLYAPSGMGKQTWHFSAVTNREKIQKLAKVVGEKLSRNGYNFYDPDVIIIVSNDKNSPWGMEDNACALENIFLAANSFGIGSVWINQLRDICDEKEVREILTEFGVPSEHRVYGIAALGYAKDSSKKEVNKIGTYNIVD